MFKNKVKNKKKERRNLITYLKMTGNIFSSDMWNPSIFHIIEDSLWNNFYMNQTKF